MQKIRNTDKIQNLNCKIYKNDFVMLSVDKRYDVAVETSLLSSFGYAQDDGKNKIIRLSRTVEDTCTYGNKMQNQTKKHVMLSVDRGTMSQSKHLF